MDPQNTPPAAAPAAPRAKIRLGDMLVSAGVITAEQLGDALAAQKQTGRKLGATLITLGMLTEDRLLEFLAQQFKLPLLDLAQHTFSDAHVRVLSEVHARRYRALVLDDRRGSYFIGMADPTDLTAIDELERLLGKPVQLAIVREADILRTIDLVYRKTAEIETLASEVGQELGENQFDLGALDSGVAADAPIVKLLRSIFEDAVQVRASDIHIEPDEKVLRIRLRVDGVLQEQVMKETRVAPALVLRLKLMAGMDIAEKRLPQDGRFFIQAKGHQMDVRISTMPVLHGESVVMRLLDQTAGARRLAELGMPPETLARLRQAIARPHGLILATGPTGSGKTTTLYGCLAELNRPEVKIITVEDPVEYRLARVNQVQVNAKIDLSFAKVLRTILRQDPDIVLVGEMRDQETAQIGLRAAMTGHLVLSTLHTNDAVSSALRLTDMGADGFLTATALRLIIAQRLLRRVCPHCKQAHALDLAEKAFLANLEPGGAEDGFVRGRGCPQCNNTGYFGRIGVYELLGMTEAMADALRRNDTGAFTYAARHSPGYVPLTETGLAYARQGLTTIEEVMRIADSLDLGSAA
ncbi:MAG: Flp pilus assembly complex ATPase component TadA [Gammaproteobacteria bacterium]|nr:Flp pilus assembly complex ATPase component TadA [Gammaproteobacteria bacterium]